MDTKKQQEQADLITQIKREDTVIWNKIIFKELVAARQENNKLLVDYWRSMFL